MSRYGETEDEFTAKINQQKQLLIQQTMNAPFLQMVGFDKVFNKQSDLSTLKIVNLRDQNVSSAGSCTELGQKCPNIEELDISKNLISSWKEIFDIGQQLPKLHWLNVSENFMTIPENYTDYRFPNIRTLICGSMELTWNDVLKIVSVFPNIEEFRVPNNHITNLSLVDNFQDLKLLDLEGNLIGSWDEVCKLRTALNLEQLNIENIGISSIRFSETVPKVSIFRSLRKLCIVNNLINDVSYTLSWSNFVTFTLFSGSLLGN